VTHRSPGGNYHRLKNCPRWRTRSAGYLSFDRARRFAEAQVNSMRYLKVHVRTKGAVV
jgi:hypothetical protein